MSRRPVSCVRSLFALAACGTLLGCGESTRESTVPPPIAASKAAAAPEAKPAPAPAPVTPVPETREPAPPAAATTAPAAPVSPAPEYTPGTSLPGAIPPSPAPERTAKPAEKAVDPLQLMRDSEARKADYQRRLNDADAAVINANANVATWEKNVLAFANPFLARPQLAPADAAAISGMDGAQRLEWAKGKLAEARASRDAAQRSLDDLKANPPLN